LCAIGAFIFYFPSLLERNKTYQLIKQNSEAMGIDNSALFYSEESKTSEAEQELKSRLNSKVK